MKQKFLKGNQILAISLLALVVGVMACKKDKYTDPPTQNSDYVIPSKTQLVVQRIKKFDKQLKEIKNGLHKGDNHIHIDTVIWNIESLFNATYSFPDYYYKETIIQELDFEIDVDDNDCLLMSDVNMLYEEIINSVRETYRNDGFVHDKALMCIIVNRGDIVSNKSNVNVKVVSGQRTDDPLGPYPVLNGPFKEGDCYYFGEYGGSCDDPTLLTDAAEVLEDTINYYYGWSPKEPDPVRSLYVNVSSIVLIGDEYYDDNNDSYYIYYHENPDESLLYLDENQLNRYYNNELKVIFDIVPNDPEHIPNLPEEPRFMEINIDGVRITEGETNICFHHNTIIYGTHHIIHEYDMSVPVDLLNN